LSDYYSETESDTKLVGIWPELKAAYTEKTGPSITQTNAEGENHAVSQWSHRGLSVSEHSPTVALT